MAKKKVKNVHDLLERIELIQAERKRTSTNAKIRFAENIMGVVKHKNGKKDKVIQRDKEKVEWFNGNG